MRDYIRCPSLSAHPLGTEGWDSTGCPSLSTRPLGTEGWDGQLGQRPTDGTPWDVPHCPYVPWGLRDVMDSWDGGLQMGDSTGCPSLSSHPLGTEGWDGQLGQRPTDGTPWDVPHCP